MPDGPQPTTTGKMKMAGEQERISHKTKKCFYEAL
jgi:hypothetical protein